ncbi:hypothetical protein IEQ_04959 [Bacillus cereus BAG6X1-2]|nr:hypothetical protein IEQ_04959 [Bacillus cereus BAG6X1-2]
MLCITVCKAYSIRFGQYAYGCFVSINDTIIEVRDFLLRIDPDTKFLAIDVEEDTVKVWRAEGI